MDTSLERARAGHAGVKSLQGLTEAKLRELQPGERAYKVSDGGNGLYVVVSPTGSRSFRYDYRLSGRRETLTAREAIVRGKAKIDQAARDAEGGTCRIQNRSSPAIPQCSNFGHFTDTWENTERYRIDSPLLGPQCVLARRCELGLK